MRPILLEVFQEIDALYAANELVKVVEDLRVQSEHDGREHTHIEASHYSVLFRGQSRLSMIITVQLRVDIEVFEHELKLILAPFSKYLDHQFIELLRVHSLKYLIFHVAGRLPQRRRNVHLT